MLFGFADNLVQRDGEALKRRSRTLNKFAGNPVAPAASFQFRRGRCRLWRQRRSAKASVKIVVRESGFMPVINSYDFADRFSDLGPRFASSFPTHRPFTLGPRPSQHSHLFTLVAFRTSSPILSHFHSADYFAGSATPCATAMEISIVRLSTVFCDRERQMLSRSFFFSSSLLFL